jgi:glycosyltransferase involved in cell wall biosynthesis/ribosomal protein S18 acetylase RimI-like enzyme
MPTHVDSKGLKILHIVGDSRYGGIAKIILGLGAVARAAGWQVDVLTTDPAVQDAVERGSLGVVNLDVIRRRIRPFWDLAGLLRLRSFLLRERYGIVHTHTSKGGFVGRLAAWLAGVPVVVHTMHGFAIHEQSPAWARLIYSALERMASRWCHRIVSVSEFHRQWALELSICSQAQIQAIPNGITPPWQDQHLDPAGVRRELGVRDDELMVLTAARLAADKGIQYLVEAAALLPRNGASYRLMVAGDGPARDRLEELCRERGVSDRVRFLGFRHDVGALLAACDLVVLPSLREGLSISLLEAMAAGKPIIASSIGSHREVAAQAEMAVLVPPADPAALAQAIQRFEQDPGFMMPLAARAVSLFEACYTEDRMLDSYRQLYLSLLEGKSHASRPAAALVRSEETVVRAATAADLADIVAIHQKAFSHFFLTRMGAEFLRRYYHLVLDYRAGIVLVSETRGMLNGFVCGFADPASFYRSMWRSRLAFASPALAALFRNPSLGAHMVSAVRRIQATATQGPPRSCELSSIAVAPEASGKGIGKTLLRAFLHQSWDQQVQSVYLTTDAHDNEAANELYRDVGFRQSRCFLQQKGRWMYEYVFHRALETEPAETAL